MGKRGHISLVFDDGYQHIYDNIVPLLNSYKMPGVFAIPLDHHKVQSDTGLPAKPWEEWLTIKQQGHEIAAHGATHQDLTSVSKDQLVIEMLEPVNKLGATTLIYPGGAVNEKVEQVTRQYYKAGRDVRHAPNSIPPLNPYRLNTYNFHSENFSILKANILALYAWVTNSWIIETYHIVDNKIEDRYTIPLAKFKKHLSFINLLPVKVETIENTLKNN